MGSNAQHLRGSWISVKELARLADKVVRFRPLINHGWMARTSTKSKAEGWSQEQLLWAIKKQEIRLPLHVESINSLFHNDKLFIVGDSWTVYSS